MARLDGRVTDPTDARAEELPPGLTELARILDHLPGMVAFWDHESRNRYANSAYAAWFGKEPEDIRGRHATEVLGPETHALNRPHIEGALGGEPQTFERAMPDARGVVRHVQTSYVPNVVDGVPSGFFVLAHDVSTRVRAESALQESVRQVALLEERQRIAADLHDFVIQRLFAAGLDLAAAQRRGPAGGPEAWSRVQSAAEGVDDAIRELRKAIHSLRELMAPGDLPESVARVVGNAGRVLGFVPNVTYTGSVDQVSPELFRELLAVLNEALSNVARHADASRVDVTLACADGQLLVRVADDGRGMEGPTTRSSGLANMRRRAELLGGGFAARANRPHGTVIDWTVPVPPGPEGVGRG